MESIAVTKPDITVARQEALSPFGLLTALFTEEIVRRSSQTPGFYRPLQLAYLEEDSSDAQPAPQEIHFDLNVELLVNRLLKKEQEKEKSEKKAETPAERILERVIVREKELRTVFRDSRRVVIETGGRRIAANLPMRPNGQDPAHTQRSASAAGESRQAGEGRSTPSSQVLRRSAALSQPFAVHMAKNTVIEGIKQERKAAERTLTLASQAMSVPSAGGWTPQHREQYPGYPTQKKQETTEGAAYGSILLPDVLRRRREAAIARSETQAASAAAQEDYGPLSDALAWSVEGTEPTSETERVLEQVRRAVEETLRRNAVRSEPPPRRAGESGENVQPSVQTRSAAARQADAVSEAAASSAQKPDARSRQNTAHEHAEGDEIRAVSADPASRTAPGRGGHDASQSSGATADASGDASLEGPRSAGRNALIPPPGSRSAGRAVPDAPQDAGRIEPSIQAQIAAPPAIPADTAAEQPLPAELGYWEEANEAAPQSMRQAEARSAGRDLDAPQNAAYTGPSAQAQTAPPSALPTEAAALQPASTELIYREESEVSAPQNPAQPEAQATRRGIPAVLQTAAQPEKQTAGHGVPNAPQDAGHTEPSTREQIAAHPAITADTEAEHPASAELVYREGSEGSSPQNTPQPERQSAGRGDFGAPQIAEGLDTPAVSQTAVISTIPAEPKTERDGLPGTPPTAAAAIPAETAAEQPVPAELVFREEAEETAPRTTAQPERQTAGRGDTDVPQNETYTESTAQRQTAPPSVLPTEAAAERPASTELVYREESEGSVPPNPAQPEAQAARRDIPTVPQTAAELGKQSAGRGDTDAPQNETYTEPSAQAQTAAPSALPTEAAALQPASTELIYREESEGSAPQNTQRPEAEAAERDIPAAPWTAPQPERQAAGRGVDAPQNAAYSEPAAQAQTAPPSALPAEAAALHPPSAKLVYREGSEGSAPQNTPRPEVQAAERGIPAAPRTAAQPERQASGRGVDAPQNAAYTEPSVQAQTAPPSALPAEEIAEQPAPTGLIYREESEGSAPENTPQPEAQAARRDIPAVSQTTAQPGKQSAGRGDTDAPQSAAYTEPSVQAQTAQPSAIPAEAIAEQPASTVLIYREESEGSAPQNPAQPEAQAARRDIPAVSQTTAQPGKQSAGRGDTDAPQEAAYTEPSAQAQTAPPSALPAEAAALQPASAELVYREGSEGSAPQNTAQPEVKAARRDTPAVPQTAVQPERQTVRHGDPDVPQEAGHTEPLTQAQIAVPPAILTDTAAAQPIPTELAYREEANEAAPLGMRQPEAHSTGRGDLDAPQSAAQTEPSKQAQTAPPSALPAEAAAVQPLPAELVYREGSEGSAPQNTAQPEVKAARRDTPAVPQTAVQPERQVAGRGDTDAPQNETYTESTAQRQTAPPSVLPTEAAAERPASTELVYREESEGSVPQNPAQPEAQAARRDIPTLPQTAAQPERQSAGDVDTDAPQNAANTEPTAQAQTAPPTALPAEAAEEQPASTVLIYREESEGTAPQNPAQPKAQAARRDIPAVPQTAAQPGKQSAGLGDTDAPQSAAYTEPSAQAQTAPPSALPAEAVTEQPAPAELIYREGSEGSAPQNTQRPEAQAAERGIPAAPRTAAQPGKQSAGRGDTDAPQYAAYTEPTAQAQTAAPSALPTEAAAERPVSTELIYREESERFASQNPTQPEAQAARRGIPTVPQTAAQPGKQSAGRGDLSAPKSAADTEPSKQAQAAPPSALPAGAAALHPASAELVYREETNEAAPKSMRQPEVPTAGRGDLSAPKSAADTEPSKQAQTALPSDIPAEAAALHPASAELVYREGSEGSAPENTPQPEAPAGRRDIPGVPQTTAQPERLTVVRGNLGVSQTTEGQDAPALPRTAVFPAIPAEPKRERDGLPGTPPAAAAAIPTEAAAERSVPAELVYREVTEKSEPHTTPQPEARTSERGGPGAVLDAGNIEALTQAQIAAPPAAPTVAAAVQPLPAELVYREEANEAAPRTAAQPEARSAGRGDTDVPQSAAYTEPAAQAQIALPSAIPAEAAAGQPLPAELVYREKSEGSAPQNTAQPEAQAARRVIPAAQPGKQTAGRSDFGAPQTAKGLDTPAPPQTTVIPAIHAEPKPEQEGLTRTPPTAMAVIPTVAATEQSAPAELVYREETEKTALQAKAQPETQTVGHDDPNAPQDAGHIEASTQAPIAVPSAIPADVAAVQSLPAELVYREEANEAVPQSVPQFETHPVVTGTPQNAAYTEPSAQAQTAPPSAIPAKEAAEQPAPAELVYREGSEGSAPQNTPQPEAPAGRRDIPGVPQTTAQPERLTVVRGNLGVSQTTEGQDAPALPRTAVFPAIHPEPDPEQDGLSVTPAPAMAAIPMEASTEQAAPAELIYLEEAEESAPQTTPQPEALPAGRGIPDAPQDAAYTEPAAQRQISPPSALPAEAAAAQPLPAELVYREGTEGSAPQNTPLPKAEASRRDIPAVPQPAAQPVPPPSGRGVPGAVQAAEHTATSAREQNAEHTEYTESPAVPQTVFPTAIPAVVSASQSAPAELIFREETVGGTPADAAQSAAMPTRGSSAAVRVVPGQTPTLGILQHRSAGQRMGVNGEKEAAAISSPLTPPHTARDIRMTAAHDSQPGRSEASREVRSMARRNSEGSPAAPQVPAKPAPPEPLSAALPARETRERTASPELFFAPQLPGAEFPPEEAAARPAQQPPRSDKTEALPPWARELLEQSGVSDTAIRTAAFGGKTAAAQGARQISWTAPGAVDPRRQGVSAGPAELSFRERGDAEETPRQRAISDAELQRTADKVYRIIEERLRRELRRSGR